MDLAERRKRRREDKIEEDEEIEAKILALSRRKERTVQMHRTAEKQRRSSRTIAEGTSGIMFVIDRNGELQKRKPNDSLWWVNDVLLPPEKLTKQQKMKFGRRYRMPF